MNTDTQRTILFVALAMVAMLLWQQWHKDYPSKPQVPVVSQQQTTNSSSTSAPASTSAASTRNDIAQPIAAPIARSDNQIQKAPIPANRLVHVKTDLYDISIDTLGGNIVSSKLLKFSQTLKPPKKPIVLFNDSPSTEYIAESNLVSADGPDTPKALAKYTVEKRNYQLADGEQAMQVTLAWQDKGVKVNKIFTFKRDSYVIGVKYQVQNNSSEAWSGRLYAQLTRKDYKQPKQSMFDMRSAKLSAAISSPEKRYKKIALTKLEDENISQNIQNGWIAMMQHYFLSAWIPGSHQEYHYYSKTTDGDLVTVGLSGPVLAVSPGQTATTSARLYMGPEVIHRLENVAPGLRLTVDYGWLWIFSIVIYKMMKIIYDVVGNWGWSIVLVTFVIKLAFYWLSAKSYRSMAHMRKLQPKINSIRERYGNDKPKMSQAMMEFYKKEKINPLSGCLPILVQIPVFLGLYWVLVNSVELRHAPFIFWIQDLSAKDCWHVLPILMGLTMFLQQKLSPPPPDPTQAKVMMLLPLIFTVLFWSFPAGLLLYWVTNNALSTLQQWYVMRMYDKHGLKKPAQKKLARSGKKR